MVRSKQIYVDYNNGNSASYAYDPLGSRTNVNSNGLVDIYDTNCLNQYTAVGPQGSQVSYLYDKNGNLADINNGQFQYVYDCENRLIEAKENSVTVATYAYDFAGRRVGKTAAARGGRQTTDKKQNTELRTQQTLAGWHWVSFQDRPPLYNWRNLRD